jgi:tRNA (guanine-N7-)-methyltransferase
MDSDCVYCALSFHFGLHWTSCNSVFTQVIFSLLSFPLTFLLKFALRQLVMSSIPPIDPEHAASIQPKWTRLPIRTRPHRNPLADNADEHPDCPEASQRSLAGMFGEIGGNDRRVEFVDVGCAFGGMLLSLAPMFPNTLMLGLEIRSKVVEFARNKAMEFRRAAKAGAPGQYHHYENVFFDQLNVMKYGSNMFVKGQLSKLFFCYPDPHWKKKNIRRRIVSPGLVHEYAFWLRVGGLLYTVSDVEELENWMAKCLDECPMFRRLTDAELLSIEPGHDKVVSTVINTSEDAQRTERKKLKKNFAVHIRVNPGT